MAYDPYALAPFSKAEPEPIDKRQSQHLEQVGGAGAGGVAAGSR